MEVKWNDGYHYAALDFVPVMFTKHPAVVKKVREATVKRTGKWDWPATSHATKKLK